MKRRRKDSGFAMMVVFLMAACIAITLYMEVPRVAFEAERQRELLLVDRGNQFKRSIQVFVTDKTNNPTHRYPATLDELESFNGHRYLRHRYKDPMTGKDEWRLVHINGGVLTDSVTTQALGANGQTAQGANGQPGQAGTGQQGSNSSITTNGDFISTQAYMDTGANGAGGTGGVQRALNRRPSDMQGAPGAIPDPNNPTAAPPPGAVNGIANMGGAGANGLPPNMPGSTIPGAPGNGMPGQFPGQIPGQQMPGQIPGQMPVTNTAQQQQGSAASCYIGDCGASNTTSASAGMPGQMPAGMGGGNPQGGVPGFGAPGGGVPGMPGSSGNALSNQQSAAASMIGNLLTTPRPGGMPTGMPGATTLGGGIAGVASKYEAEGIMVINQRTKINEWEYIFDQTKYRAPPNPLTGPATTPLPGMPANGGTPIGSPAGTPIGGTPMGGPGGQMPTAPGPGGGGQGQGQ